MEYLIKKGEEAIQLPIKPASFQVSFENSHQTVNVQTRGDVSILGKKGLETFTLESFFRHMIILLRIIKRIEAHGHISQNSRAGRNQWYSS